MSTQITQYQCPSCYAPLHFVGESGKLECDYCGGKFDVAEIEALYADQEEQAKAAFEAAEEKENAADAAQEEPLAQETDWDTSDLQQDWGEDGKGLKTYSCPSCGAELICDETTAATSCPYCGNNTVIPGQFGGALKPDYVIPFKLDKAAAVAALKKHYGGKLFLPKAFSNSSHLEEVKGIYVPFWLFDAAAEADCTFLATRSHTHTEGDYRVTVTEHYHVRRSGSMAFEKIPADGSKKMRDDYMDSIEPFDYTQLEPFSTVYLPGYLADKYDVSAEDCMQRADQRCRGSALEAMRNDVVDYQTVTSTGSRVSLQRGKVHYALMPVWTLHTKWEGKDYLFMMNGQTGKMVGDLPVSRAKFWGLTAALSAVLSGLLLWMGVGQVIAEAFLS